MVETTYSFWIPFPHKFLWPARISWGRPGTVSKTFQKYGIGFTQNCHFWIVECACALLESSLLGSSPHTSIRSSYSVVHSLSAKSRLKFVSSPFLLWFHRSAVCTCNLVKMMGFTLFCISWLFCLLHSHVEWNRVKQISAPAGLLNLGVELGLSAAWFFSKSISPFL